MEERIIEARRLLRVLEDLTFCADHLLQDHPYEQRDILDAMDIIKRTVETLLNK